MEYEKPIQATPFSKKLMAPAKTHPYDGVFVTGRSGKLRSSGAVVDDSDYAEIFRAGSTGCSIPVLDIPEPFESASGGGRSSRPVDYSKIFGGLADSTDFGVPFEDLLPPKPNNTRTNPAKTRTRSRGRSRRFSFSEEKQESMQGPPEQQPLAGVKEFNVSYNRTDPGSQYGESRTVPVAELHVVNGYSRSVVNDAHFDENAGELPRIPKLSRRSVSGPQPTVAANEASQSYGRRRSGRNGSMSKDMFDAFEIGGATQSSGVRSPSSAISSARDSGSASRRNMPENKPGNLSPSFSDEEVDANSVAAASAAAVRKAIEEAQRKIKFAKELMERRKEGRVNFAEMNFGSGFKVDKKVARRTGEMLNSSRVKEAQEMNGKEQVSSFFGRMSNHEQIVQVSPDLRVNKESSATEASRGLHSKSEEAHGNERVSTRGSRSDDAMKHDPAAVEHVVTNSMKNATPSTHENGFRMNMKTDEKSAELTECLNKTEVNEEDSEQGKVMSQIEVVTRTFQWSFDTNSFKSAQDLEHEEEHASEVRNARDLGEADQAPYVGHEHGQEQVQLDSKQPEVEEREDITDMLECQGDDQYMLEMGEAISGVETTDHETERCSHNLENSGIDVVLRESNLINGKPREWESTECQENQEDSSSPEVDEYRESNGHWEQDIEMKFVEICEENVMELRSNDLHEEEKSNTMAREHVIRGHDKKETVTMGEQIPHVDCQKDMTQNKLESSSETDRMHSQTCLSNGDEEEMEVPLQKSTDEDGDADADAIYNHDENEKFMETEEGGWYEETLEGVSVTAERIESPAYANETEESDKEREAGEDANVPAENGFDAVPHPQVFVELENTIHGSETLETMNNTESAAETDFWSAAETDFWSQQKQGEEHLRGLLDVHDREPYVEEVIWESDESGVDIDESEVGCNEEEYEGNNTISGKVIESQATCVNPVRTDGEVAETIMSSDVEENNVTSEDGEEIAFIHGEEDNATWSSQDERQMNDHMHAEAAEQFSSSEGVGRMTEVSLERKFQCSENIEDSRHKAEEKDVVSQSEVGIQNKHNLEKDELREKERQRIVVDRAIKEARERAFADARERAKKAAADKAVAESRQRETAAASKMPEKAPTEANGKLAADRPAKDAKLKAERAAVERATAEARERALEKALAEKAAAIARSQAAKTAAEKFPSVSKEDWAKFRNNRSYDHQHNGKVTSSSLRQPSSSHHAASNPAEKAGVSNDVSGSAYWSKATSERHQRTAERAAKALAEKNMRDLLAQREQAERHRLAETLDVDVKRWSSGKERSLRALLSTLQYILGPDSGWQSIPLTDLVSTASVKKAYRKATLVVHPDKLQQRGASIQQKYICEKVFDLLKEAWNKFSAEER